MLHRSTHKNCRRLYWRPDTTSEKADAFFTFNGEWHRLTFDGKVDEVILSSQNNAHHTVVDVSELSPFLPRLTRAWERLREGASIAFANIRGRYWTARLTKGRVCVLQAGADQVATITFDEELQIDHLVLRTHAPGITHEISAKGDCNGNLTCVAEAVTIYVKEQA